MFARVGDQRLDQFTRHPAPTDLGLYDTFNTAYRSYFHGHFPARTFIGVASILRNGHFEVQAIAAGKPAPPKQ